MIGLARSSVILAATALTPEIPGALTHRFRSDYGVATSSGAVTQWDNMVAANHATQSVSLNRPTLTLAALGTHPGITFDGTNAFLDVAGDGTVGARTYIIVARTSKTATYRLFDHGTVGLCAINSDPRAILLMGGSNYRYFNDFAAADDGAAHVFTVEIAGAAQADISSARLIADGAAQTPSTTLASAAVSAWSGMRLGGGSARFAGDMFEVLIYNRVLTATELGTVHLYLRNYYQL
ncbi:MAG: hypothetical protein K0Q89_851 [Thermomicrobiales bacterium]|jgi:hypothetical protein|nr:hypothetical protein [Thermomicrobiales bacterium]